ncbi:MAG: hypothetical protein ACI8WB_001305 [Phenylobacterium sp.]|jgi:hypothetical protein
METIGFKTTDTVALWQWLVLGGFCGLLVVVAALAKRVGQSNKNSDLSFNQINLSRQAKLYQLRIDGQQYNLFESDKGLIELTVKGEQKNEASDDQQ